MKKIALLIIVISLLTAGYAFANPTPGYITNGNMTWARGDAGSTWQQWDFLTSANSAAPTAYVNTWGLPTVDLYEVAVPSPKKGFGWMPEHAGRFGVWAGDAVYADLTIPNTDSTEGSKIVWMEVGFQGVSDSTPILTASSGQGYVIEAFFSSTVRAEGDWKIMTIGWLITPNPQEEMITVGFVGTGGYIDYITVDTQCSVVPVPGAIVLGGMGVGLVGWFRRRRA